MEIRRAGNGYVADTGFGEIPLPSLRRLRNDAIDRLLTEYAEPQQHAADILGQCELAYAVVKGKDDFEELIQIVITAPDPAFTILSNPGPTTDIVMDALQEACPDIESSHLVRM